MDTTNRRPLLISGLLIGIGIGGFFDGVVFHQILQTHQMLSNIILPDTIVNIEINMFWDGLFHALTMITTITGLILLWKAVKNDTVPKSNNLFIGSIILGIGIFNFVEGIIDHLILQLHHVIQRTTTTGQYYSDTIFLILSIILMFIGAIIIKQKN